MKLFTSLINTIKEHFRLKLIICFILCAILPLLILGTISYKISYNIAKDKILKETAISCEKNQHLLENTGPEIVPPVLGNGAEGIVGHGPQKGLRHVPLHRLGLDQV